MRRIVLHELPDGSVRQVRPFHVSLKGLKSVVLCRDDTDYDAMVKILCVAAKRKNVVIIIYAVVSNHCHVAILAESQQDADAYGIELKKIYSMWFSHRYGERNILKGIDSQALSLDSDWYVRNALAYIPRNALDNGCNVNEYRWSGYRAMFGIETPGKDCRRVSTLSRRETRALLHTSDRLRDVPWLIDPSGQLVPASFCDHHYLEQVFERDQSFFLKTIGGLNNAEMKHRLIEAPRQMMPDSEYHKLAKETCQRWYGSDLSTISLEKKIRLLPYLYRTTKTSIPQLARVLGMEREKVAAAIQHPAGNNLS